MRVFEHYRCLCKQPLDLITRLIVHSHRFSQHLLLKSCGRQKVMNASFADEVQSVLTGVEWEQKLSDLFLTCRY